MVKYCWWKYRFLTSHKQKQKYYLRPKTVIEATNELQLALKVIQWKFFLKKYQQLFAIKPFLVIFFKKPIPLNNIPTFSRMLEWNPQRKIFLKNIIVIQFKVAAPERNSNFFWRKSRFRFLASAPLPPANFEEVCVPKQKNFLYISDFLRAPDFFKKEKKIFRFGVPRIRNGGKSVYFKVVSLLYS